MDILCLECGDFMENNKYRKIIHYLHNDYVLIYDTVSERYYIEHGDECLYDFECLYEKDAIEVVKAFMKGVIYDK